MPATLTAADNYLPLPDAAKYATLKDGENYYSLAGARSFSFVDVVLKPGRNYRDKPPVLPAVSGSASTGASSGSGVSASPTTSGYPAVTGVSSVGEDDEYKHVAPRVLSITKTFMVFWSGTDGSGNVIAMFAESLFEQFSPSIPVQY